MLTIPIDSIVDVSDIYSNLCKVYDEPVNPEKPKKGTKWDSQFAAPYFPWSEFIKSAVPEDKIWKGSTDVYIDFPIGYIEGDKSRIATIKLGHDGDIHGLGAGGTGAGKSAFWNQVIMTICNKYSPNDLELWLADFKKVTFSAYLPDRVDPTRLPHVKACVCTSDPAYAVSVIEAFEKSMTNRLVQFTAAKEKYQISVDSLKNWNEECMNRAQSDPIWLTRRLPRMALIVDELKALYLSIDGEYKSRLETSLKNITNLGRASGNHMFLSSQRVADILPNDIIAGSSARFCLRVETKEISTEFIGTDDASNITQKNGLGYCKGLSVSKMKPLKFAVPYLDEKGPLQEEIKKLYNRAVDLEKEGKFKFPKLIAYNEDINYPISDLEPYAEKFAEEFKKGMFIFGNKMVFDLKSTAPFNWYFDNSSNNHIFSIFQNNDDLFKFLCLIKKNAKYQGYKLLLNTAAGEAVDLAMKVDEYEVPKELIHKDSLQFMKDINELYKEKKNKNSKTPCYVICLGWNKHPSFTTDVDMDTKATLLTMLNDGSQYGIHFIFINTGDSKFKSEWAEACNLGICSLVSKEASLSTLGKSVGAYPAGELKDGYLNIKAGLDFQKVRLYVPDEEQGVKLVRSADTLDIE